jgi:hypothetical protein
LRGTPIAVSYVDDDARAWRLAPGTFDVGPLAIKVIGAGWLLVAIVFGFAALGVLLRAGWWQPLAYGAVGASVLLSAAGWPEARLGLVANVLVVVLIVVGQRLNWL